MTAPGAPHVVVLGGGSAGWITACLLHHRWAARGGTVTVVESPEIGIIGVGEGSTPQLKAMFDHLGIAESEWMAACDATFKFGIRFSGWSERPGFASYFHPFPGPVDLHSEPAFVQACALARRGFDVPAHPDDWFLATLLAEERRGPQAAPGFPFAPGYGYHFDAYKLGAFLREWSVARGVEHISARVGEAELAADGDVAALVLEDGRRITGDLYVDCSGFRALIAQEALGGRFVPFGQNLFNDRAVVIPTAPDARYRPQTDAIAMRHGWRWRIPLTARTGNGYVYSSRHCSDQEAEDELRAATGTPGVEQPVRFLQMKVGRVEHTWHRNCVAAGLAQGFIEPLEATALHIVIATALEFASAWEDGGFTPVHRDRFNRQAADRYDGIRDYIVGHFKLNQRSDTAYWRENAANDALSDRLKGMITAWFTQGDLAEANRQAYGARYYSAASWHCLLAGYGTFPPLARMRPLPDEFAPPPVDEVRQMLAACATNFTPL